MTVWQSQTAGQPAGSRSAYDHALTHRDDLALVNHDGRTVTFAELVGRAHQLSRALRAAGVGRLDRVAVIVRNGVEYFELALATGQIGAYMVPINWHLTPVEIAYIVANADAKLVVAEADLAGALDMSPGVGRLTVAGRAPGWSDYAQFGATECTSPPPDRSIGAVMLYTSGTTGRPKGVLRPLPDGHPEDAQTTVRSLTEQGIRPDLGIHLVTSPLYHAAPGAYALARLATGRTVVIMDRFDAVATLRAIERYRVTDTHMVPTQFQRLLALDPVVRASHDLGSLTSVVHAAAPCPVNTKRAMIEWLGPIIYEYLGATEGLVCRITSQEWLQHPGSVGKPLVGQMRILDEHGVDVAVGEVGTIYFHTGTTPYTYHKDPAMTAENHIGDYVTVGDLGHVDETGYLFVDDRRSDLILRGGVNIYPAEIEHALVAHPAVLDVAVVGEPDFDRGQTVLAVVQLAQGHVGDHDLTDDLLRFAGERLAWFKLPRRFVYTDRLPRTDTGKLQRRKVRDEFVDQIAAP